MTKTVADVLVESLAGLGVDRIYGVVGDSLNAITHSIQKQGRIQWIHTRHEESAAFAAAAEAQLTGNLAVCAGSCGPGNLHLINGLYDGMRSRAPVLAIAAQIPSPEIGSDYFQETHPEILFKECSVFCELVSSPVQMPRLLGLAIQAAITHQGVAVLVIPGDIALASAVYSEPVTWPRTPKPRVIPSLNELQRMAQLLENGKVTLLCGHGCAEARDELMQLCDTLKSPMVHALRGKEYLEYDNPYDVGMTGFIGFSSGYYAIEDCDTLLMLGTNFPYRQFYPKKAQVIQVDIRGEAIGRRCPVELGVVGDVKETIRALLPLLKKRTDSQFLDKAVSHYQKARMELDILAKPGVKKEFIHPQYLAKCVSDCAKEDTIFSCDVGTATVWTARYVKMNGKRRLLGSFNHGSMANALSQAIGAQATFPNRQVVALCGDGGFSMLMGDFITLAQLNLPVKVIVFNNGALDFVELEMKSAGFMTFGTDLKNPNFADMSNAMGIHAKRVEDASALESALQNVLSHPGPALLDVVTNRLELAMPPAIQIEQAKGFSLYVMKALLDGRGKEVLDMATTNLWR
ncbi:MAG: hypothetical protein QG556_302 [Pseudomonadota bacterium]|nr:hypothetical protein [Pseudomonadota bacterium]